MGSLKRLYSLLVAYAVLGCVLDFTFHCIFLIIFLVYNEAPAGSSEIDNDTATRVFSLSEL